MAAFCSCCGAEITLKAESCPVCKTPRHGMMPLDWPPQGEQVSESSNDGEQKPRRSRL
jgi:hypothetical protein